MSNWAARCLVGPSRELLMRAQEDLLEANLPRMRKKKRGKKKRGGSDGNNKDEDENMDGHNATTKNKMHHYSMSITTMNIQIGLRSISQNARTQRIAMMMQRSITCGNDSDIKKNNHTHTESMIDTHQS